MAKSTPPCKLHVVKAMLEMGKVRLKHSALTDDAVPVFDGEGIVEAVKLLTMNNFYKSMATHADYKMWQDVYRPTTRVGEVYLKLIVSDDVLIVSFKEL